MRFLKRYVNEMWGDVIALLLLRELIENIGDELSSRVQHFEKMYVVIL